MIRQGDRIALALEGGCEGQLHGSEADVFHALWETYHRVEHQPRLASVETNVEREAGIRQNYPQ